VYVIVSTDDVIFVIVEEATDVPELLTTRPPAPTVRAGFVTVAIVVALTAPVPVVVLLIVNWVDVADAIG
jgi:hypothetical protein